MSLSVCSDTRLYQHPQIFIAFPGARHNPLDHLEDLLAKNCPLVIYQNDSGNQEKAHAFRQKFPATTFVQVTDSITFAQELSRLHALAWRTSVPGRTLFAISGSNGKTTHKEMLAFILGQVFGTDKIVATEKNNNNHLGVPLTLFRLNPNSLSCVLELGSNHPGEIKVLCDIAKPNAGLVTNIGATHLEFFGTEENVFLEEGWLFQAVAKETQGQGFFLQNLDDPFLGTLKKTAGTRTFSRQSGADFQIHPTSDGVEIRGQQQVLISNSALTGGHNKQNMAVAWIIATTLFPESRDLFTRAAQAFRPTKNRSEWCEFRGHHVYLDAYNANPSSMKVAIEGFFDWLNAHDISQENALLILGDMNELGEHAPEYHREVGEFLKRWPATEPVFVGRFAQDYKMGRKGGHAFTDAAQFRRVAWDSMTQSKTHLFIKGSRSLQLESLLVIT